MIITKLQGGLANQIFQWSYGKYLSEKYNTPLYLDTTSYLNQVGITKREFSLNKFPNLKYQILPSNRNISNLSNEPEKVRLQTISDNFNFNELNYHNDSHYYLNGYWQSEKYFKEIEDTIRRELQASNESLEKFSNFPINENNISIHIRRTDYVMSNGYHPLQSIEYYQKGIDVIREYDNIFVFSDDINWCKENLQFKNMIFIEGFDDVEDIWLMSLCKNNIIANSSFSWWAAWLNSNSDKKVIAPLNWFGIQANLNTYDIIPDNWIKI
jgi:hypothetical protein